MDTEPQNDNGSSPLSEEELFAGNSVFKEVFYNNQAIMLIVDPDNRQRILAANEAALGFYGYGRDDFFKLTMGDINVLSDTEREKLMQKALARNYSYFQFDHKTASDEIKAVEVHASPVVMHGKKVMFVIIHDISSLKKTESVLTVNEAKYRSFFESSPLSLWEQDFSVLLAYLDELKINTGSDIRAYLDVNPDVVVKCSKMIRTIDVNKASVLLYEAQSKEDLLLNFEYIDTEKSYELFKEKIISLYHEQKTFSAETEQHTLKGNLINIKLEMVLVSGSKALITITDITEQLSTKKKLMASENKFRSYFESSPLSLWEEDYSRVVEYMSKFPVTDREGLLLYFTENPEEVLKCLSLVDILNLNQATLDLYEADSKEQMKDGLSQIFTQNTLVAFRDELVSVYMKETLISKEFTDKTLKDKKVEVKLEMKLLSDFKYLTTIMDLTEQKKKETELKQLLAQTRSDSETKEILLREINHRVKNNLSSFIGMLYAEKRQAGHDMTEAQLDLIEGMINRVKGVGIAHELLSVSNWTPVPLCTLADKIIHSISYLIPSDRSVEVNIEPSSICLNADQSHSMAVIINELFANCIEHAVHAGERISVDIDIKENNGEIVFIYSDNGPGFPPNVLISDFQNVGLYLIKNIVRQNLRGTISLFNNGGAVVSIGFPGGMAVEEI